jgi:uncharacterized protein (TIGR00251 family)
MPANKSNLYGGRRGAALAVRVTPRSSKNEITEIQSDGTIKIRLTAPPVDGKANKALIEFLADVLDIAPSKMEIAAGETARDKLIVIFDMDPETVNERLFKRVR